MSEICRYVRDQAPRLAKPPHGRYAALMLHETALVRVLDLFVGLEYKFLWDDTDSVRYRTVSVSRPPFAFLLWNSFTVGH